MRVKPKTGGGTGSGSGGRNADANFRGEARSNSTHASTTDPDARLFRKGSGTTAVLGYLGHSLMENRQGLIVDVDTTLATGTAEREAAVTMLRMLGAGPRRTVGADKNYDVEDWVQNIPRLGFTPHVAQNITRHRGSKIDGRTTRHLGYEISQRRCKMIEESFGWSKTIANLRKRSISADLI